MRNKFVISKLFNENEDKLKELYYDYLSGNIDFKDEIHDGMFFQMFYEKHKEKYKLRKEVIDEAAKSFASQLKHDGEVRSYTFMMFMMLELFGEVLSDVSATKGRSRKKDKPSTEKRDLLFDYFDELKMVIIEEGPDYLPEHYSVHDLSVTKDNVREKYKIKVDVTTENLYMIFKDIHRKRRSTPTRFKYTSPKSLGQSIRHHKEVIGRGGFRIFTYRRSATHIVIEYILAPEDAKLYEREAKKRKWR